eukprot:3630111-Amphidinium_carterae.1
MASSMRETRLLLSHPFAWKFERGLLVFFASEMTLLRDLKGEGCDAHTWWTATPKRWQTMMLRTTCEPSCTMPRGRRPTSFSLNTVATETITIAIPKNKLHL